MESDIYQEISTLAAADAELTAILLHFAQECYSDGEDYRRHPDRYTKNASTVPDVETAAFDSVAFTLLQRRYVRLMDNSHANHLGQWAFIMGAASRRWE